MIRHERLQHRFVNCIPAQLEPGVLYISMEYATAAHSCCCGCGEKVVTPFTLTDWRMTFDGETISIWPSVKSWTLPCRSHYIIAEGSVVEAYPLSDRQMESGWSRDRAAKAPPTPLPIERPVQHAPRDERQSGIGRLLPRFWPQRAQHGHHETVGWIGFVRLLMVCVGVVIGIILILSRND